MLKYLRRSAIAVASVLGLALLSACEVHEEAPPPPRAVVVEPGYYYEPYYYDVYHVYHPAVYFYFDGNHYERREFVPHGYIPRLREHDGRDGGERGERGGEREGHGRWGR